MGRAPRIDVGNCVYHVINRSNGRARIFHRREDYEDMEYLLNEIHETHSMRILAYTIMPNHWLLLLYPRNDGDLGKSLHWLTTSHVRRHHSRRGTIGHGHIYQGPYKSFLVQTDTHLLTVLKYIERNPVRAKLARTAQQWRWGSAHRRVLGSAKEKKLLATSPVPLPRNYSEWVNTPEPAEALGKVRQSVASNVPFGDIYVSNIMQ